MKADLQPVQEPKKQSPPINGELQRAAINEAPVTDVPPIVHEVLRSPGQPLDAETRAFFEPRFRHDFSSVRVHTDAKAAESARAVDARAYTVGQEVVVDVPHGVSINKSLLAHELAHTLQQGEHMPGQDEHIRLGPPGDAYEQEANRMAETITSEQIPTMISPSSLDPRVQRQARADSQPNKKTSADQAAIAQTLQWLKTYKRTAKKFFDDIWTLNDIVILGETHADDVQRQFAIDMLTARGGPHVALALEIPESEQEKINYYIRNRKLPKVATKSWARTMYKDIIDAAVSTGTSVIAMDSPDRQISLGANRNVHMAETVSKLAKKSNISKILAIGGMAHHPKDSRGSMGNLLGGNVYTIIMLHPYYADDLYWPIQRAFPTERSIGFDIGESPLSHASAGCGDVSMQCGANYDGYIYFRNSTDY